MALSDKRYDWRRYWAPREGAISFNDQGFISEPGDEEFGLSPNHRLFPLNRSLDFGCLALLGEPGIGRTETLGGFQPRQDASGPLRAIDLAAYGSDSMLYKAIFESPEFTAGSILQRPWRYFSTAWTSA